MQSLVCWSLCRRARPLPSSSSVRRGFITLPDLSALSPFASGEPADKTTYHERQILPYTRRQLYDLVSDVESYRHFVPYCVDSKVISVTPQIASTRPDGRTALSHSPRSDAEEHPAVVMEAQLSVGFSSLLESYVSKVTCTPFESVEAIAASSTPLFESLSTVWRFQPAPSRLPHPRAVEDSAQTSSARRLSNIHSAIHGTTDALGDPDKGPTLVTLDLAYAFANPLHRVASKMFFGQVSKQTVQAFEKRCLEVYGPGKM